MRVENLIIGSGLAGLYLSQKLDSKETLIITKDKPWQCNSFYAQGGIATALNDKDIDLHIKDTFEAGAKYGDREAIETLIKNSQDVIKDLIDLGLDFDKKDGVLNYTKEGGHSINRILHADGDATGRELHLFLMQKLKHKILDNTHVVDFLIKDNICHGATVLKDGKTFNIYAKNTILASGGVGSLYKYSTNDKSVSGDLQGLCVKRGIPLIDMQLIQFHPTTFTAYIKRVNKKYTTKSYLLSEALRGEGAFVVDKDGNRFLFDYDKRGELAPRDIVSRAIFDYTTQGKEVFLSFKNMKDNFFEKRFPNIYKMLQSFNFSIPEDKIPISPAYHYIMGGVKVDISSRVYGFKNFFAIGEIACTKVHGANRLASNSLLEALVFAKIVANNLNQKQFDFKQIDFKIKPKVFIKENDVSIEKILKNLMWSRAGIVRRRDELNLALKQIDEFLNSDIGLFLEYKLLTAKEIITSAIRSNSIGAHFILK